MVAEIMSVADLRCGRVAAGRMRKRTWVVAVGMLVAVILIAGTTVAQQGSFKVVVNPEVDTDSVSKKDLLRLYLKRTKAWPTGQAAVPVDQVATSPVRTAFSQEVIGKNVSTVKSYWNGQIFAGKPGPPRTLSSDQEVLDFVRSTPGAVGYVSASAPTSGVKVLDVEAK